jgi:microcystin-dependent protein
MNNLVPYNATGTIRKTLVVIRLLFSSKINTLHLAAVTVACFVSSRCSYAQSVPALLNYQGQLQNPNGSTPPTADYELTANVYDAPSGGTLIWGPQRFNGQSGPGLASRVPVVQGYFNLTLGPQDTAARNLSTAFDGSERYVELRVGTNPPIAPRQQLLSAPYALKAEQAGDSSKLAGQDWSPVFGVNSPLGPLPGSKIQAQSITGNQIALGTITASNLSAQMVRDSVIPAGTIMAFAGQEAPVPPGWLLCDGSEKSISAFPRLSSVIGTSWGPAGVGNFKLPDLRGVFLRGVNGTRADSYADPDRDSRQGGNAVGSLQPSMFIRHNHGGVTTEANMSGLNPFRDYTGTAPGTWPHALLYRQDQSQPSNPLSAHTHSIAMDGGNETRPVNAYVHYIIKD